MRPFAGEAPQRAVGADVVEAVIVNAGMREVRRHSLERARLSELEELALAGRIELQQRGAVDKSFRPLRPAARGVAAVDREDRRAEDGPRSIERADLRCRELERRDRWRRADREARVRDRRES
jgi:hypothetical protein